MGMYGILDVPFWVSLLIWASMVHATSISVSLYLHRAQAHEAIVFHPVVSHLMRGYLWLTTSLRTFEYIAVHRKHHSRTDEEGDPHSPWIFGIMKVLKDGWKLYRIEAANPETIKMFAYGAPDDKVERYVYSHRIFTWCGILLLFLIEACLFGVYALWMWPLQMLWIPFFAAGIINGIGHWWGYRLYNTKDKSRNIPLFILGWFATVGEEHHNSHHSSPKSARFSRRWWEIDMTWCYVRVLWAISLIYTSLFKGWAPWSVRSLIEKVHYADSRNRLRTVSP